MNTDIDTNKEIETEETKKEVAIEISEIKSKHVRCDFSQDFFNALANSKIVRKDENDYVESEDKIFVIQKFGVDDEEFEKWCLKEEEVLEKMSDVSIVKLKKTIDRKKWWNQLFKLIGFSFKFNLNKENQAFQKFLSEFMLRMNGHGCFDPVGYDLYRGMRPDELSIDMHQYEDIYKVEMTKRKKERSLFSYLRKIWLLRKFRRNNDDYFFWYK